MSSKIITKEKIKERYEIFNDAKKRLKEDFYGIDNTIDEIFKSIETWYIYNEYMMRPCIINLWGLTGVGKTDLMKKLKTYLKIESFASTELDNNSNTVLESFDESYHQKNKSILDLLDEYDVEVDNISIVVFDEIHRFRTINDKGELINKSKYNDIWKLLSDGTLTDSGFAIQYVNKAIERIEHRYNQIRSTLSNKSQSFEDKLAFIMGINPKSNEDVEAERKAMDEFEQKHGYVSYNMKLNSSSELDDFMSASRNNIDVGKLIYFIEIDDEDINQLKKFKFIYQGKSDFIINEILLKTTDNKHDRLWRYFNNCSNKVLLEWLKFKKKRLIDYYKDMDSMQLREEDKKYIYSKMLIVMCGNVEKEDYDENGNIDIYKKMNTLFRPEQVSRFGNSYIIYPILTENAYKDIIKREIEFTINKFLEEYYDELKDHVFDIDSMINDVLKTLDKDYIYSGVRPVISATQRYFSTLIPPLLIKALNKET
ncbi:hypothetical protein DLH72_04860 [Candidatus Gracilibacteria bacterium]|nr:MAG: hypothetical protein DLH72_04860 [Candidatus Gracilibacteria bacterium]